jgi:transcriptional regulator with XRE-family HTH domain
MPRLVEEVLLKRRIGRHIRRARLKRGLSRKALAEAVGIEEVQVVAYESGSYPVTAARLVLIAAALGVGPVDLMAGWA